VSFPCKNLCMERVPPEERPRRNRSDMPDAVQNAEQVSPIKQR
jgi:hypothetical protein